MAAKKTSASPTKADFVRSIDPSVPAKAVIAQAKDAGIALTESYIYNVRGADKAAKKKGAKGKAPSKKAGPKRASLSSIATSSVENLLRAAAAEIGLAHAIEILQGERAKIKAVIGG